MERVEEEAVVAELEDQMILQQELCSSQWDDDEVDLESGWQWVVGWVQKPTLLSPFAPFSLYHAHLLIGPQGGPRQDSKGNQLD